MAQVGTILLDLGEISGENIFIDGTKIESVANKYTLRMNVIVARDARTRKIALKATTARHHLKIGTKGFTFRESLKKSAVNALNG